MSPTGGFDLVAQIRAPFVGDIVASYYTVGSIPHDTTIDLTAYGLTGTADVALNEPLLWIDTDIPGEVRLIVTAQVSVPSANIPSFQVSLNALLIPTVKTVSGVATGVVSLDNMNLTVTVPSSLGMYQAALTQGISAWLSSNAPFTVMMPSIPKQFTNVQIVPIDDAAEMGRTNVSLCLSMTSAGATNAVSIFIMPAEDFGIAMSGAMVQSAVSAAIAKALGGPLPRAIPQHSYATLDDLNLSLIDGGFQVSGDVTIDPGPCLPNIGVSFSGPVQVSLNPDGTVKVVSNISIGESVWFWILSFVLAGLPLIIAEIVLNLIADNILNSVVGNTGSSTLSGQNVFGATLPQVGAGGVISLTATATRLTIHPDALVLAGMGKLSP